MSFDALLRIAQSTGLSTEDLLAAMLPLFREVAAWHASGLVAKLDRLCALETDFEGALKAEPEPGQTNPERIATMQRPLSSALKVIGQRRVTNREEDGVETANLEISDGVSALQRPAYIPGYRSWESAIGHHDAASDIFALGQLFASLALGLDFHHLKELSTFVSARSNLFALNPQLHPVLASVIVEMTELNRHRRSPDLASLIRRLETYRDQTPNLDLTQLPGFAQSGVDGRRKLIQTHLRDRLFEISRRNRLLYFKPSHASLNLTVASVPMVVNLAGIRLDQLFIWQPGLAKELIEGKPISLGRWLRFEDQPYLPSALDKIIAEARRARAEYGCAQLRLVIAFLHWHNLKESADERIVSPLLLVPVELSRKKGVRDQYLIDPISSEAEVNPALRHHLNQLYGLRLPQFIDLRETPLEDFHRELQAQIRASEPGVTLRLVDQPEIQLIQERARQRLAQFNRRQALPPQAKRDFTYSYQSEHHQPLALQLFEEKVRPSPLPQRAAAGALPQSQPAHIIAPAIETERQTFTVGSSDPANPYVWDFDLCSLTVGNFNYRKMSLVRDYGTMLEEQLTSDCFERIFSTEPRPLEDQPPIPPARAERWPVLSGDATQTAAVDLARTGRSYIIQGPPGTGKSQTITNLIADYVARGKRVLFVCEKRAALDVVFHRLHQRGLDELCCLIHDSQTDKKGFISNLKQTYELWLSEPDGAEAAHQRRNALLTDLERDFEPIERFDVAMRSVPSAIGEPLRELLHRLVVLGTSNITLPARETELLPTYAVWRQYQDLALRAAKTLTELKFSPLLAEHPFRWLGNEVIRAERPLETLDHLADRAESLLENLESALRQTDLPTSLWSRLDQINSLIEFATRAASLAERNQLSLLDPASPLTKELHACAAQISEHERSLAAAERKTQHWKSKIPESDLTAAITLAQAQENSLLRWLSPSWWQLRKAITSRYDFSPHAIPPKFSQLLSDLQSDYQAKTLFEQTRQAAIQQFGREPAELIALVEPLQAPSSDQPAQEALRKQLLSANPKVDALIQLGTKASFFRDLVTTLQTLLAESDSLIQIKEALHSLRGAADALPDLLPLLRELAQTPPEFAHALRSHRLPALELESVVARTALENVYRSDRWLLRFDGHALRQRADHLSQTEHSLLVENAATLRAEIRRRFRQNVQTSGLSSSQLDEEGKQLKKSYTAGRKNLEHEFGKSMRYKSIRELAAGDSGRVLRDLKPIWLMSPLSVSDTLPLSCDLFDVVIFDEASQIPTEEAVPALYRAPQVIVVGDEMQLPPTKFFATARDSEEETVEMEEDGERIVLSLDAESLLTQSAKNLPATLLAWHYRSRSESLINFSNAAFYAGNLYTIPDRALPIQSEDKPDGLTGCASLLDRPLSFHFQEHSPYEARRNQGEAAFIAQLVREILRRETRLSIGVVAFSEAQQGEIESALEALAEADPQFGARLEEEYTREEDDQHCGLFVKNLENVQGDERDIILLSICYGPDSNGRMLMNFGPINQRGGEKRLNVIFSRARHHMAVISSIRHTSITNDYNDGAAALKSFLQYAEHSSRGEIQLARGVLETLNPLNRKSLTPTLDQDAVISQLAEALRKRGLLVDEQVGQSKFRCHLAIRIPGATHYSLGLIVDTAAHYTNANLIERYVTQPEILRSFGWKIALILTRDWQHQPKAVLEHIERLLNESAPSSP